MFVKSCDWGNILAGPISCGVATWAASLSAVWSHPDWGRGSWHAAEGICTTPHTWAVPCRCRGCISTNPGRASASLYLQPLTSAVVMPSLLTLGLLCLSLFPSSRILQGASESGNVKGEMRWFLFTNVWLQRALSLYWGEGMECISWNPVSHIL